MELDRELVRSRDDGDLRIRLDRPRLLLQRVT
jgi:hypothetical protein